ncbi:MAG: glycosyltransferase family 9 protein [Terracidiphilus sp.]
MARLPLDTLRRPVASLYSIWMSAEIASTISSQTPKGPLLIRLCNWVGEAVLSLPALHRLAAAGYDLQLYGKTWAPALFEGTGWPVMVRSASLNTTTENLRALRRKLGAAKPPPALLMTNSFSSALEARLGGFSPSGYANEGRSWLLRHAYRQQTVTHAAHSYWNLANRFLGLDEPFPATLGWTPSESQRAQAQALLARHQVTPRFFAILCPFSGPDDQANQKVWPHFGELASALQAAGIDLVLCPGPGEEQAAAALRANAVILPNVDLGVYGALFLLARCVVANDTGPGHLAAAAGARLISIYGPHSVSAWTPIGPNVRLFHDLAKWPSVESIAAAVLATI